MTKKSQGKFETRAIHVGNKSNARTGSVSPAIHLTSTFEQDGIGKDRGFDYSRAVNPTRNREIDLRKISLPWKMGNMLFHFPVVWPQQPLYFKP